MGIVSVSSSILFESRVAECLDFSQWYDTRIEVRPVATSSFHKNVSKRSDVSTIVYEVVGFLVFGPAGGVNAD